jgi:hypothetical protein
MTNLYSITYNPQPVTTKPRKYSAEMNRHVAGINVPTGITINQFAEMVSAPYSHTWYGGTYTSTISNQNWLSTQIFGLDFDGGDKTPEETIQMLESNGVIPQLWYTIFSSTPKKLKYRVLIFTEQPVTDFSERDLIYKGLLQLIPYADHSCKNAGGYFLADKRRKYYTTNLYLTSNSSMLPPLR